MKSGEGAISSPGDVICSPNHHDRPTHNQSHLFPLPQIEMRTGRPPPPAPLAPRGPAPGQSLPRPSVRAQRGCRRFPTRCSPECFVVVLEGVVVSVVLDGRMDGWMVVVWFLGLHTRGMRRGGRIIDGYISFLNNPNHNHDPPSPSSPVRAAPAERPRVAPAGSSRTLRGWRAGGGLELFLGVCVGGGGVGVTVWGRVFD